MINNPGILSRGTKIKVGSYTLLIDRYLSAGGYAHVYICTSQTPIYSSYKHVLKRIAVQSLDDLKDVGNEVEMMKLVRNSPHIVNLIDAAAYKLPQGGHEVFILMEYCAGGGLIDIMNQHLKVRLTESQILDVFLGVTDALTHMHALTPKILHRDLKIENILKSTGSSYKLCDFGSATLLPHPLKLNTVDEIKRLEAEFNRVTTIQYRSPEMIDLYQWRYIDEKCDIWALGVLLYKLCYYTTPFENEQGGVNSLAILNAQYSIPTYPLYSSSLNTLISSMLRQAPRDRPAAVDILRRVHQMRGTLHEFNPPQPKHSKQPSPLPMKKEGRPLPTPPSQSPQAADMYKLPPKKTLSPSDVTPQRRGRVRVGEKGADNGASGANDASAGADAKAKDPWHVDVPSEPLKAVQTTHTRTTHTLTANSSRPPSPPHPTIPPHTSKSLPSKLEKLGKQPAPSQDPDLDAASRFPDLDAFGDHFETLSRRTVRVDTVGTNVDKETQRHGALHLPPDSPDGLVIEEILPRHLRVPREVPGVGVVSTENGISSNGHASKSEIENLMDARVSKEEQASVGRTLSPTKTKTTDIRSPSPSLKHAQPQPPSQSHSPIPAPPSQPSSLSSDDDAEDIEYPLSRSYDPSKKGQKQSGVRQEADSTLQALKADLRYPNSPSPSSLDRSAEVKGDELKKEKTPQPTTIARPAPAQAKSNLQILIERDSERTKAQAERDVLDEAGYDKNAYPLISPIREKGKESGDVGVGVDRSPDVRKEQDEVHTATLVDITPDAEPGLHPQTQPQPPTQTLPLKGRLVDISEPSSPSTGTITKVDTQKPIADGPPLTSQLIDVDIDHPPQPEQDKQDKQDRQEVKADAKPTLKPKPRLKSVKSSTPLEGGVVSEQRRESDEGTQSTHYTTAHTLERRHTVHTRPRTHTRAASIGSVVDRYETMTMFEGANGADPKQKAPKSPLKSPLKPKPVVASKAPTTSTENNAQNTPPKRRNARPTSMYVDASPTHKPSDEEGRFPGVAARIQQWNKV